MYLRVAQSAPAPAPGVRVVPLPTVVTPDGVRRGMGYVLIGSRRRGFRGLGDTIGCAPYDIASQLSYIAQASMNQLGFGIESGTAMSPADFAGGLQANAVSLCSKASFGCAADRCAVPTDVIASLAAEYAAAYDSALQAKAREVAAGDICVPSLALFPGIVLSDRAKLACGYGGAAAVPASPAAASPPPSSSTPTGLPLGVTIQNMTGTSNTQFRVGDNFRVVVTGPANTQVTGSASHDGNSMPPSPFGSTDANGRAVITGAMTASTVGGWVEQWLVGGQPAGSISFSVAAAPAAAPAPPPDTSKTAPPPDTSKTAATNGGSTTNFDFSFLKQNAATVGGFDVPWWLLLGGGALAVYAFSGSRGKR